MGCRRSPGQNGTGCIAKRKNALHVAKRVDRYLLMSLFEQNEQILQANVDLSFGQGPDAERTAFDVMVDTAKEYEAAKVDKNKLKNIQDGTTQKGSQAAQGAEKTSDSIGVDSQEGDQERRGSVAEKSQVRG